jgi:hypothetical protein
MRERKKNNNKKKKKSCTYATYTNASRSIQLWVDQRDT